MEVIEDNGTEVKSVEVLNFGGEEDGNGHTTDELVLALLVE